MSLPTLMQSYTMVFIFHGLGDEGGVIPESKRGADLIRRKDQWT